MKANEGSCNPGCSAFMSLGSLGSLDFIGSWDPWLSVYWYTGPGRAKLPSLGHVTPQPWDPWGSLGSQGIPGISWDPWDFMGSLGFHGIPGIPGRDFIGSLGIPGIPGDPWDLMGSLGFHWITGIPEISWGPWDRDFMGSLG